MSDLVWLYVLTFLFSIYSGYEEAIKLGGSITGIIIGCITGLVIGAISFYLLLVTDRIWVRANQKQTESMWAVIGVTYFLISGLLAPVIVGIISGNASDTLITWVAGKKS